MYINPCLLSLNSSNLGFDIGLICTTTACVADDAYLLSNTPIVLHGALDIISHYAKHYQLKFNTDKTKVEVAGSKLDKAFYKETAPWTLDVERVHLWRICNLPVLLSGLPAFPIRPTTMKSLEIFQQQILRGYLNSCTTLPPW